MPRGCAWALRCGRRAWCRAGRPLLHASALVGSAQVIRESRLDRRRTRCHPRRHRPLCYCPLLRLEAVSQVRAAALQLLHTWRVRPCRSGRRSRLPALAARRRRRRCTRGPFACPLVAALLLVRLPLALPAVCGGALCGGPLLGRKLWGCHFDCVLRGLDPATTGRRLGAAARGAGGRGLLQ
jgi:hypothetical protein